MANETTGDVPPAASPGESGAQDSTRRALATLLAGNRVLMRETSESELLRHMCAAVVTAGGYAFAWYGVPLDDDDRTVLPVASAGEDAGYVDQVQVSWGEGPLGQGPTGECLRTRRPQVRNDLDSAAHYSPWLSATSARGIHCSISLPVVVADRTHGALMVYARERGSFDEQAQEILENLAADVGYGIGRLRDGQRLRATLDSLLDPHVVLVAVRDEQRRIVDFTFADANDAACRYNGRSRDDLLGMRLLDLLPEHATSGLLERYAAVVDSGAPLAIDDYVHANAIHHGQGRWYDMRAAKMGEGITYTWRDVTDRHEAAAALAESEARFRLLAENTADLVLSTDLAGVVNWVSPSITSVLGYAAGDVVGRVAVALVRPQDRGAALRATDGLHRGESPTYRARFVAVDGHDRWMEVNARTLRDVLGRPTGTVLAVRDVAAEVRAATALKRATETDDLTGLARRPLALQRIQAHLDRLSAPGWPLVCVGVRGLRAVNEAYTYAAGDKVLQSVAGALVRAAGAQERVARIAGDEFAVILPDLASTHDAERALTALLTAVRSRVSHDGHTIEVHASVGVALSADHDAEALLRDAASAMRLAAERNADTWQMLDLDVASRSQRMLRLRRDLRDALAVGEISAWFMPIVDLRGASGSAVEVCGHEALALWTPSDGSVRLPSEFLAVAEGSDLVVRLDAVMLAQALDALAGMSSTTSMAVNISAPTLAGGGLVDTVRRELARTGADPTRLHLEVTETALFAKTADVARSMRELADLGVTWWVDDFGTGYSSISHLRDLPIRGIKLDRSFTAAMLGPDDTAVRLTRGLAGLAAGLRMDTVAEGIETEEQGAMLADQGWRLGQGWLFGQAAPAPATTVHVG